MRVLVINQKGVWSFSSYEAASDFRQDMVSSLNDAELDLALKSAVKSLVYSIISYYA